MASPSPNKRRNTQTLLAKTSYALAEADDADNAPLSISAARAYAKGLLWRGGEANSLTSTSIKEMAGLGIGFQLYFTLLDKLFMLFLALSILSLPSILSNYSGGGISSLDTDSLSFALFTLGNRGFPCLDEESSSESSSFSSSSSWFSCPDIECGDTTRVCILGNTLSSDTLSLVTTTTSCISFLLLVYFVHKWLPHRVSSLKHVRDQTAPSAARYSVLIRGLPTDVTEELLSSFFSSHYDLSKTQPFFPSFGISAHGVSKTAQTLTFTVSLTLLTLHFYLNPDINYTSDALSWSGFGYASPTAANALNLFLLVVVSLVLAKLATLYVSFRKIGNPSDRETPQTIYETRVALAQQQQLKASQSASGANKAKVYVDTATTEPVTTEDDTPPVTPCLWQEYFDETQLCNYYYNQSTGSSSWEMPPDYYPPSTTAAPSNTTPPLNVSKPVMRRPAHLAPASHDYATRYTNKWVTEISLIHRYGRVIRAFRDKSALLKKIELQREDVIHYDNLESQFLSSSNSKPSSDPFGAAAAKQKQLVFLARKQRAMKALESSHRMMEDIQWKISGGSNPLSINQVVGAVVTFEHEESRNRCMNDYRFTKNRLVRYFQPKHLQFSRPNSLTGELEYFKLLITNAPEPSEILWENLEFPHSAKQTARAKSQLATFFMLFLSLIVIYFAYQQQAVFESQLINFSLCADILPSVYHGDYDPSHPNRLLRDKVKDSSVCASDSFYITFENPTMQELQTSNSLPDLFVPGNSTHLATTITRETFASRAGASLCDDVCQPATSPEMCPTLPCGIPSYEPAQTCSSYSATLVSACYCYQEMSDALASDGYSSSTFNKLEEDEGDLCYDVFVDYVLARGIAAAATGVIVLVNLLLKAVVPLMTDSEHHSSSSGQARGAFVKVSVAQIINTALSTLFANAQLTMLQDVVPFYDEELESKKHADFTSKWYATVGTSLCLTMFFNAISPHAVKLLQLILVPPLRFIKRKTVRIANQHQLNELFVGSIFVIETRFAFIANTVFVTLVFCGGLPILLPFAAFTIFCCKFVDRWCILKESPQPPAYDERLTEAYRQIMIAGIFLHVFVTSYMFGNTDLLPSDAIGSDINIGDARSRALESDGGSTSFADMVSTKMFRVTTFPLFALGSLYTATMFVTTFISPDKIKNLKQLLSGKIETAQYFAPGFNSTFHSLLTEEQKWEIKFEGDLSKEDLDKGYRRNKKNPSIINRYSKNNELLLTWEVAELDGFLHTYDIAQNERYEKEYKFIQTFLDNFKSMEYDPEEGGVADLGSEEHTKRLQSMQKVMLAKVQESDRKTLEATEKAFSRVAANKWVGAIKLQKENQQLLLAQDCLKRQRANIVAHAFKYNMNLNRIKKQKEEKEQELTRIIIEKEVVPELLDAVCALNEEEGDETSEKDALEKMLVAKSRDAERYRALFVKQQSDAQKTKEIMDMKYAAMQATLKGRGVVGEVCLGLVGDVVERVKEEERAALQEAMFREKVIDNVCRDCLYGIVGSICDEDETDSLCRLVLTELVEKIGVANIDANIDVSERVVVAPSRAVEAVDSDRVQCIDCIYCVVRAVEEEEALPVRGEPRLQELQQQINRELVCRDLLKELLMDVEIAHAAEAQEVKFTFETDEEAVGAILDKIVSRIEQRHTDHMIAWLQSSFSFEREIERQQQNEGVKKLKKELKERLAEQKNLASTPRDFFGAGIGDVEIFVRSQDDLLRAECELVLNDLVHEVWHTHETDELREKITHIVSSPPVEHMEALKLLHEELAKKDLMLKKRAEESFLEATLVEAAEEEMRAEHAEALKRLHDELTKKNLLLEEQEMRAGGVSEAMRAEHGEALKALHAELAKKDFLLEEHKSQLANSGTVLEATLLEAATKEQERAEHEKRIGELRTEMATKEMEEGAEHAAALKVLHEELAEQSRKLASTDDERAKHADALKALHAELAKKDFLLEEHKSQLANSGTVLEATLLEAATKEQERVEHEKRIGELRTEMATKEMEEGAEHAAALKVLHEELAEQSSKLASTDDERAKHADALKALHEVMALKAAEKENQLSDERKAKEEIHAEMTTQLALEKKELADLSKRLADEESARFDSMEELRSEKEEREALSAKFAEKELSEKEYKELLDQKETTLLQKIRENNEINIMLIDAQRLSNERGAVLKEESRMVKESIEEATEFKMKLRNAEEEIKEMHAKRAELEGRMEQLKANSEFKKTLETMNEQLKQANDEKESMIQQKAAKEEKERARLEGELEKQRQQLEDERKADKAAMEGRMEKMGRILADLQVRTSPEKPKQDEVAEEEEVVEEEVPETVLTEEQKEEEERRAKEEKRREQEIELLRADIALYEEKQEKNREMEIQLKRALKRIISMKRKQNEEQQFNSHMLEEKEIERREVEEQLEAKNDELEETEKELQSTQKVVLSMEEEKEADKRKFSKVMAQVGGISRDKEKIKSVVEDLEKRLKKERLEREEDRAKSERMAARMKKQLSDVGGVAEQLEVMKEQMGKLKGELKKEQMDRKIARNAMLDLQGKIRVMVRCRPLVESEFGKESVVHVMDKVTLGVGPNNEFNFDAVMGPTVGQDGVFDKTKALVENVIDGYNACIFAYGQTGSGKTYTMAGGGNDEDVGLIPRSINLLFEGLRKKGETYEWKVKSYFVELYVNKLIDLYGGNRGAGFPGEEEKLEVKLDAKKMVYVKGAIVKEGIEEAEDLVSLWAEGEGNRHSGSTLMNYRSSRSHSVLSVVVETKSKTTGATTTAKLSLIDLAGSERVKKSGVDGQALQEAVKINASLSVLSDVIGALSNEAKFVPYRNNKLTQLMQDSLGGNSKTLMIVNVSPSRDNFDETLMALHYASRARLIQNKSVKNKGSGGGGGGEEERERLKKVIEELKEQNRVLMGGELRKKAAPNPSKGLLRRNGVGAGGGPAKI